MDEGDGESRGEDASNDCMLGSAPGQGLAPPGLIPGQGLAREQGVGQTPARAQGPATLSFIGNNIFPSPGGRPAY